MTWSALTHNGTITAVNRKTGTHRTFQVKTQKDDANFMPGRRIVSLKSGPLEARWITFGLVDLGRVILWRKNRDSDFFKWAARFLANPSEFEDKVALKLEGRCRVCNRKLTTPASIDTGVGPVCGSK